ncbi:MAG: radical SAM protein [Candidatus Aureabacteria bacterium]|nr:radical SAM protein [Candidatus Auribacterota bacterium]
MKSIFRYCRILLTNPRYFARMSAVKIRSRFPIDFYLMRSGYAFSPVHLTIEVTHRCNLSCHMCDLYGGDKEIDSLRSRKEAPGEQFSLALMEQLCDSFHGSKPVLSLGGGEPLLHPQIAELISCAKRKGLLCTLTTNGTLLEKYAAALTDAGLDSIVLSIDGPEKVHDATRGMEGAFARARAGARALAEYRRRKESATPRLRINCTINSRNFSILSEIPGVAEEFGAESLVFSHLWFWDREAVDAHNRSVGHLCRATEQNTDEIDLIQPGVVSREISKIKGSRTRLAVKFLPDLSEREIERYYSERAAPVNRFACRAAWLTAFVMPNGEVIPCLDYRYGKLGELPFEKIWNGERALAFRKCLRGFGIFPACVRCCGLYAF